MAPKKGSHKSGEEQAPAILTIIPDWADAAAIGMLVGLSDRQIQNLTRSGVLTKETPPGRKVQKYRTCKAVQQYIAHVKQKAGEQEHPKELVLRKLEAEVKLKESQGQLASIKADIAEGRYIETASAAQQLTEFLDTFKHFALNIPSRVAGTVAGYTDAATARAIEKSTRKELEDMYNEGERILGMGDELPLPGFESSGETVSGAGVLGEFDDPTVGYFSNQEMEIPFRVLDRDAVDMLDQRKAVRLTIRGSAQSTNSEGDIVFHSVRVVVRGRMSKFELGKLKAGSGMEVKITLTLLYILIELDGEPMVELDKLNEVFKIRGKDMLAEIKEMC